MIRPLATPSVLLVCLAACGVAPVQESETESPIASEGPITESGAPPQPVAVEATANRSRAVALQDFADLVAERELDHGRSMAVLESLVREAPGRRAGSASYERAATWAERTMRRMGLRDVHREPVVVDSWERGPAERATLHVGDEQHLLRALALDGSPPTPAGGVRAPLLFVETYEELRSLNGKVQGKIVFVNENMSRSTVDPRDAYDAVRPKVEHAASIVAPAGAVALLMRSVTLAEDDLARVERMVERGRKLPSATVSPRAADLIRDRARRGAELEVDLQINSKRHRKVIASSVFGEIRGMSKPEEIVLVAARLDSFDVGEGAHADGAGVAHVLEAARLILTSGLRPARTIRFGVLVQGVGDERGLRAYVRDHVTELGKHVAVIYTNNGGFSPRGFAFTGTGSRQVDAAMLAETLDGFDFGRMVVREEPIGALATLARRGIPSFELLTDCHLCVDIVRSARDTLAVVEPRHLSLGTIAIAFLAGACADPSTYK